MLSRSVMPSSVTPWTTACQGFSRQEYWSIAISSSRGSSPPRDQTHVSCTEDKLFTHWGTGKTFGWSSLASATRSHLTCKMVMLMITVNIRDLVWGRSKRLYLMAFSKCSTNWLHEQALKSLEETVKAQDLNEKMHSTRISWQCRWKLMS